MRFLMKLLCQIDLLYAIEASKMPLKAAVINTTNLCQEVLNDTLITKVFCTLEYENLYDLSLMVKTQNLCEYRWWLFFPSSDTRMN